MRNKGDSHQNCTLSTISMSVMSKQQVHSRKGRAELKTNPQSIQENSKLKKKKKGPQHEVPSSRAREMLRKLCMELVFFGLVWLNCVIFVSSNSVEMILRENNQI